MPKPAAALRFAPLFVLATMLVALALPARSAAQSGPNLVISSVDTSRYPRVELLIAAPSGDPGALSASQPVRVHEQVGGATYMLTPTLELAQPGVSLVVLVDLHRRMRGIGLPVPGSDPPAFLNRLDTARAAIVRLAQALSAGPAGANRLGVIAYHRDLIEVMPLQPLQPGLVESYIMPDGSQPRLFDIEPKPSTTPANDRSDPHAKSALSLAVQSAADLLAAQAPAHQQRAIVIIGTTCTDLSDKLTNRSDVTCDTIEQTLQGVRQGENANLLTIYGVGVGSRDTQEPRVDTLKGDAGFNYTANFHQIELLAGRPERFFILHTPDPDKVESIWEGFAKKIIAPIQGQATQLKVGFDMRPQLASAEPLTATLQIELQNRTLPATITIPQLELLVGGAPVLSDTLQLAPGQVDLAARYTTADAQLNSASVKLTLPTPTVFPDGKQNNANSTEQHVTRGDVSLYASIVAFLIAMIALFYWFSLSRTLDDSADDRRALVAEDQTLALSDEQRQAFQGLPQATRHYLQQIYGPQPGAIVPVFDLPARLGSDRDRVHIWVDDPYVSPTHATLEGSPDTLTITDSDSKNGTRVNGIDLAPGKPVELQSNDKITLGWVTFVYMYLAKPPKPDNTLRTPARGETGRLSPADANAAVAAQSASKP